MLNVENQVLVVKSMAGKRVVLSFTFLPSAVLKPSTLAVAFELKAIDIAVYSVAPVTSPIGNK